MYLYISIWNNVSWLGKLAIDPDIQSFLSACAINIAQTSVHARVDLSPSLYFLLPLEFNDILF